MAAGEAITRAEVKSMSLAEFEEREDELTRWASAGGKDGEPAPPCPKRPDGHQFTISEIESMSLAEFDANTEAIMSQRGHLSQTKAAALRAARAKAGR